MKTFSKLRFAQEAEIHRLILEHSTVTPQPDGKPLVDYHAGWSDLMVADAIPNTMWGDYMGRREDAVAGFRIREVGVVRRQVAAAAPADLRLDALWAWALNVSSGLGTLGPASYLHAPSAED